MADEERDEGAPDAPQDEAPEAGPEPDVSAESAAAEPPSPEEPQPADAGDAAADEPAPGEEPRAGAEPVAGPADAEAAVDDDRQPPQPDAAVETEGASDAGEAGEEQVERQRRERARRRREEEGSDEPEVIPGAHLEPDLVLEAERTADEQDEFARYAVEEPGTVAEDEPVAAEEEPPREPGPVARTPLDLAADARYRATGKRKRAVARVILKPGNGSYTVNGKDLSAYFPRPTLAVQIRQPLETVGYGERMDVVARIHGGGVASQAGALRHGIARAIVEADPNLRGEMKRRGFLTRDARVKERKKAGLKKARKRPQFSKR